MTLLYFHLLSHLRMASVKAPDHHQASSLHERTSIDNAPLPLIVSASFALLIFSLIYTAIDIDENQALPILVDHQKLTHE